MKNKTFKFAIIVIAMIAVSCIVFILFRGSDKSFNEYAFNENNTPDLSNKDMSLEDIESQWMEYESNRPTIDLIDSYEWSIIKDNINFDMYTQDLDMIVSSIVEGSTGYDTKESGFEYDFITDETTSFQGEFSWSYSDYYINVYYVLTPQGRLYIRVWRS